MAASSRAGLGKALMRCRRRWTTTCGWSEWQSRASKLSSRTVLASKRFPSRVRISIRQPVAKDAVESLERIFQANFLALRVIPSGVGNRHFVDAQLASGNLGG